MIEDLKRAKMNNRKIPCFKTSNVISKIQLFFFKKQKVVKGVKPLKE